MLRAQSKSERSGFPLRWGRGGEPAWSQLTPKEPEGKRIAYFMNVFPYLSETFIYREVNALRTLGCELLTFAIRRPEPQEVAEEAQVFLQDTFYILPVPLSALLFTHHKVFWRDPGRYWRILRDVLTGTHDSVTDRLRSLCHFVEAVTVLPVIERSGVSHVHAHFAVGSATCAWIVSRFLHLQFSFTAHAYDIWLDRLLLPEKLQDADFVVTCTAANMHHLVETYQISPAKFHVIYHGVNVERFVPCDNGARQGPPRLLAVARLVEQKGLEYLLQACALLQREGYVFSCEIVGDGPLATMLSELAAELELGSCVQFAGRVFQEDIMAHYAAASLFVLPCIPASNNDRDGIPNTLMEAMACGLPIVSTAFSGIPELVIDGEHGVLVGPGDAVALAGAIRQFLDDPDLGQAMGAAGRARVVEHFSVSTSATTLCEQMLLTSDTRTQTL